MKQLKRSRFAHFTYIEWGIILIFGYFFFVLERQMLANIIMLIISVVIHELAHGLAAYYCGDSTAKHSGRLTLNPLAHLDPMGSIMLPLMLTLSGSSFLFGWAKPVPVNTQNLNDPLNDMVKVAVAGPLSNISLAVLFSQIIKFHVIFLPNLSTQMPWFLKTLQYGVVINIVLAVFNMIPIPPMDGSRVLYRLLPYQGRSFLDRIEPYGMWIIIILAFFGAFDIVLRLISIPLIRLIL